MPSWRKLVVSGSDASLNSLNVSNFISGSSFSGNFTGSFKGDGSQLTGISATIADQSSYSEAFTSVSSSTITHNLNVDYPLVQVYGTTDEQLLPKTVRIVNNNTVTIEFDTIESGHVIIAKGGHIVSIDAPNSNTLNNQSGSYYLDWNNFTNIPSGILSSSNQIASEISGAFTSTSSSLSGRITSLESFSSSLDSTFATDTELSSVSSSLASDLTGLDGRLDTLEGKTLLSSSAQIAQDISGSFISTSSSLASDITGLDTRLDTLESKTLFSSSAQVDLNGITGTTFANSNFTFPSNLTVEGTLTAEKFITEYVSSSIVYESGSTKFGDSIDDKHEFTGSVEVLGGITGSLFGTATTASYYNFSGTGILSGSEQIASEISGAFTSVSSSIAIDVTGLDGRLDTLEGKTLLSSSAQIASDISGAFTIVSGGFSTRLTDLESFSSSLDSTYATDSQLTNVSSSLAGDIVGLDGRLDTLEGKTLLSSSNQIATDISGALGLTSSSLASRVEFFEGKTLLSSSAQIASDISGAFTSFSSSAASDISGLDTRLDTLEGKTLVSESVQIILQNTFGNLSGSRIEGFVSNSISSSYSENSNLLDGRHSSVFATTGSNTFTGTQTFNNIIVNGTGSFAYIESVTGSAKIIGDAFIILNNNAPAEPYAGLKVIDSGSTNVTSSLLWDGVNNHWIYENASGSTYNAAGLMAGPRSTDINGITYPTQYKIIRSQGGDHLYDSNITDDDTKVSISIPLNVTSDITSSGVVKASSFEGNLVGNASTSTTSSYSNYVEYSNVGNKPTLLSSSAQIASDISGAFVSTSSSLAGDITSLDGRLDTLEGKTLFSSSIQVSYTELSNIPTGIVSGSDQLTSSYDLRYTLSGSVSQADWNTLQNKPSGIVSSSSQVSYTGLSNIPSGIVSSSAQLNNSTLSGMTVSGSFNGNGNDLNITGSARTFISPQRGFVTTDNDGTFDMNVGNNFKCQPTGSTTLNFSNTTSGQSGFIILINTGSFTISANSSVKVASDTLTTVSVSGSYVLSYVTDGTNVYVVDSGALS